MRIQGTAIVAAPLFKAKDRSSFTYICVTAKSVADRARKGRPWAFFRPVRRFANRDPYQLHTRRMREVVGAAAILARRCLLTRGFAHQGRRRDANLPEQDSNLRLQLMRPASCRSAIPTGTVGSPLLHSPRSRSAERAQQKNGNVVTHMDPRLLGESRRFRIRALAAAEPSRS